MNVIIFGCMQCCYAAADLAGTMKLQYDVTSRIIRMPCTARLDINFILKALQEGADGVLIVGCHPGDCAYKTGNLRRRATCSSNTSTLSLTRSGQ
jgi:coenzyme F420-reducing hydrogenase delta subunit